MKLKILVSVLVFLFALPLIAAPPQQGKISNSSNSLTIDNGTVVDVNRILMFVTNHGNFGRDLGGRFGYDYGTWYPYTGDLSDYANHTIFGDFSPNYASGIWIGAVDSATTDTLVTISEYSSEYVPGPMGTRIDTLYPDTDSTVIDTSISFLPDNNFFRVYKLFKDSLADNPNQDYIDYLAEAVPNQGAPVDGFGEPDMFGSDQFLWTVYNDADPGQHANIGTAPLGVEVKQSVYGWKSDQALGDIVFVRYRIYNKGDKVLENTSISIWADPDLGTSSDDFVGCDTLTGLGYVYNDNVVDGQYGSGQGVPAMGFDFLQGPLVGKSDPSDPDGIMWGQVYTDSTNLGMESFNKYINGTDPDNEIQAFNYMNGLTVDGNAYSFEGQELKYVLSGDPVTRKGDLDIVSSDRRWMQSTGPLTFRPGDSTEIYVAIVMGQSADNISSIIKMRANDLIAQQVYDSSWQTLDPPAALEVTTSVGENSVTIGWTNASELVQGTYPFQGYNVYQGESKTGPWKPIASYDIIDTLQDIYDWKLNDLNGALEFVRIIKANNLGLKRFINIYDDVYTGRELQNITEYHFKVEAYSYSSLGLDQSKVLTISEIVSLTPQAKIQDVYYEYDGGDVLAVNHTSGTSAGVITPRVIYPDSLTGDSYKVVFSDTIGIAIDTTVPDAINHPEDTVLVSIDIAWHFINTTTGDTLLAWQTDQDDIDRQESLPVTDGFILTVTGPAVIGLDSFDYTGSARQIGGVNWGGSGFFGGIGLLGEWWGTDLTAADVKTIEIRWVADGAGQNAYVYDRYDYVNDVSNGYVFEAYAPQNFEVWDVTSVPARQINFAFVENDWALPHFQRDQIWNPGEQLEDINNPFADSGSWDPLGGREYFEIMNGAYSATADPNYAIDGFFNGNTATPVVRDILWGGWLNNRGSSRPTGKPEPGDVFTLVPAFINTSNDIFTFTSPVPDLTPAKSEAMLDKITSVPNPFYLFNDYSRSPGVSVVKFHHLPTLCTISIYNLAGELVKTIEKNDAESAIADWDVLTENGLPVASGIYIYVVDAPGYGQKVGKMAIFVEEEVLRIY